MKFVPASVTRQIGRQVLKTKKNSPHIFFAAGVVGVLGSTVLACRATLKLEETLDEARAEIKQVKTLAESSGEYDQQQYVKDLGFVYGKHLGEFAKLYGPSVILGALSIAALTGSHVQLARRNTALTATLAAASKAFDDYRVRVQNEIGEGRELDIYRDVTEVKTEDGEVHKTVGNGRSMYARCFDEFSDQWERSIDHNRTFLQAQLNYFNHKLNARGHVFLNEVYDALGFERTPAGAIVGWVRDGEGDGHVDFGMFEASSLRFMQGNNISIWLDFNVDGVIYDKI